MKKIISVLVFFVLLFGLVVGAYAAQTEHLLAAQALHGLGLISGTGVDAAGNPLYELDRAPTRSEAITVLVKLLGKAEEAGKGGWDMPFTDVPDWAKNFVGYAYENGLTAGTSPTTFGGDDPVTAAQYITFVLKALDYSAATDFQWDKAWELSNKLGITDGRYNAKTNVFLRGDVFLISEAALGVKLKDSSLTLNQKLLVAGVYTQEQYDAVYNPPQEEQEVLPEQGVELKELNAEQIYNKCSPAVFTIEVLDSNKNVVDVGSGFFLSSSGIAVTNAHVLENTSTSSVRVVMSGNHKVYKILHIYDYDMIEDWVVFQVDGSNFPCMEIGDQSTVVGGATVFTVGSPLGFENTISQGLISNSDRVEKGIHYIQMSAAISYGSSGSALVNKYGQVIGIASNSYLDGQNLNIALPMTALEGYSTKDNLSFTVLMRYDEGDGFGIKPGDGSDTRRSAAYYQLKAFVHKKWNTSFNDLMAYEENRVVGKESCSFQVVYSTDGESLIIRGECPGKDNTVGVLCVVLTPTQTEVTSYFYLYPYYSNTYMFYGERVLDSTFKTGVKLPFRYANGDFRKTGYAAEFSCKITGVALTFADDVIKMCTDGTYGISDFGIERS